MKIMVIALGMFCVCCSGVRPVSVDVIIEEEINNDLIEAFGEGIYLMEQKKESI